MEVQCCLAYLFKAIVGNLVGFESADVLVVEVGLTDRM